MSLTHNLTLSHRRRIVEDFPPFLRFEWIAEVQRATVIEVDDSRPICVIPSPLCRQLSHHVAPHGRACSAGRPLHGGVNRVDAVDTVIENAGAIELAENPLVAELAEAHVNFEQLLPGGQ